MHGNVPIVRHLHSGNPPSINIEKFNQDLNKQTTSFYLWAQMMARDIMEKEDN